MTDPITPPPDSTTSDAAAPPVAAEAGASGGGLDRFFAKLQSDSSGALSLLVVFAAGILLAYILWVPFAQLGLSNRHQHTRYPQELLF